MTPEQLRQLKLLRERREQAARLDLAAANRRVADAAAERDRLVAAARALEVGLAERNRAAVRNVAQEGTNRVSLARMALQHQIGQEELVGLLKATANANGALKREAAAAEDVRRAWSVTARGVKKLDRIETHLSDQARVPDV